MKIVIGNLTSTLETDNPKIIAALRDKYSFAVPGYEFSQAYKQRRWDGKKRYFGSNGKFRTGLLSRIVKDLNEIGATDIEWENKIEEQEPFIPSVGSFEYREYQEKAIYQCLKKRRAIVDSPTGSGKTLIMAGCIAALQHEKDITAVVLFREKGILNQTYEFFKRCGIRDLGYNSGEGYIPGKVMLSTVQSIEKIIDTHLHETELLMVDEAHLISIAVREEYRRLGIGELLLISIADLAAKLKARIITLEVRASNIAAQRLYYKYGLDLVGLRPCYYSDNGEDAVLMTAENITSASFRARLQQLRQAYSRKWGEARDQINR